MTDGGKVDQSGSVNKPAVRRKCPACGNTTFYPEQYPADTMSIACADCENRCLLVDLREATVDSRWFDDE
jgi:ribosomal protein S27E